MDHEHMLRSNTQGIKAHAQQKALAARQRVDQAIEQLIREQEGINFNVVAKRAEVTKSYLYAHVEIRERIEALRQQQNGVTLQQRRAEASVNRTDKSKNILLIAKDRRIRELEEQNQRLREDLKVAYGKIYEQI